MRLTGCQQQKYSDSSLSTSVRFCLAGVDVAQWKSREKTVNFPAHFLFCHITAEGRTLQANQREPRAECVCLSVSLISRQ